MAEKILDKIIRSQYRGKVDDWVQYAQQRELLGLEIIDQIVRTKGNKHVHVRLPQEKVMYETHQSLMHRKNKLSLQEAEDKYRRNQLTTTYQYHHGYSLSKPNRTNIFHYKTLQKLDLAKPLNPISVSFIDNWLSSSDKQEYQDYVLACLRSLKSKVEIADAATTEMRTAYNWRTDPKLSKPLRMDKIGEDLFGFKPNLQGIRRQEQKQRKLRERVAEIEKTEFAKQISIYKDFKIN